MFIMIKFIAGTTLIIQKTQPTVSSFLSHLHAVEGFTGGGEPYLNSYTKIPSHLRYGST